MAVWHRRPAWLIGLVGLSVAVFYVQTFADPRQFEAHRESAVSWTALLLMMSCSVASVSGAVEAGYVRQSRGPLNAPARGWLPILVQRIWPSVAAGAVIQTAGAALLMARAGTAPDPIPWVLILVLWTPLPLHSVVGYVLGLHLRAVLAVPLALLASYCWLGFAWTVPDPGLRYLAGPAISGCCTATTQLNPLAEVVLAAFSLCAALVLAMLIPEQKGRLSRPARVALRVGPPVALVGVIVAVGVMVARPIGFTPQIRQAAAAERCSETDPTVCLNAIQTSRRDPSGEIAAAFRVLAELGLPRVSTVRSNDIDVTVLSADGTADVVVQPWMQRSDILHSVASTYAVDLENQDCPQLQADGEAQIERFDYLLGLGAWTEEALAKAMGEETPPALTREDFQGSGNAFHWWASLHRLSGSQQRAALVQAYSALASCRLPSTDARRTG